MNNSNGERWDRLCNKYKQLLSKSHEGRFVVGRFAIHLQRALAEACGCDQKQISHFRYEFGYAPEADESTKATSGFDSVSEVNEGWVFGLGIQLEIAPNAYPKTVLVAPVTVDVDQENDLFTVTSSMFQGNVVVHGVTYEADLRQLAERMYTGLDEQLDLSISGQRRAHGIGFISA